MSENNDKKKKLLKEDIFFGYFSENQNEIYTYILTLTPNSVDASQIVFNTENWQNSQTITILAIDDDDMERAIHETTLNFMVATDFDSPYYNYLISDLVVEVEENDCGAWGFNRTDFNLDCQVNLEDFAYFAQEWTECSTPDPECQDFRP